ncbi:MAG: hypothetical protein N4A45_04110 [Flavobacteriales bacterium]|nr:hypothetical protein [Flavobacteriales bacterium]
MLFRKILLLFTLLSSLFSYAQMAPDTSISVSMIEGSGSFQIPVGDLADRYGNSFSINVAFYRKTANNFTYGLQVQNYVGSEINDVENLLGDLNTTEGGPIDNQGGLGIVDYQKRGMNIMAQVGKILPLSFSPNINSGLWVQFGAGYVWDKIKIEDLDERVVILNEEITKGYDKLSGGLSLYQSIGYVNLSNNKKVNFHISLEFTEGFTTNLRGYDYKNQTKIEGSQFDFSVGLRFGWILPIYGKRKDKYYYY